VKERNDMPSNLVSLTVDGHNTFDQQIQRHEPSGLTGLSLETVQVNIGLKCNLACRHCHVESSPKREEAMSWQTMEDVLRDMNKVVIDSTASGAGVVPYLPLPELGSPGHSLPVSARSRLKAALISARCVKACGKLPNASPHGPVSSA
jgi:hypothetical protein